MIVMLKFLRKYLRIPFDRKGVGMIEVLIAMILLSIGALAMANMMVAGIRANKISKSFTEANVLAQDRLERLLYQDTAPESDFVETYGIYTIYTDVNKGGKIPEGLIEIRVKVSWILNNDTLNVEYSGFRQD